MSALCTILVADVALSGFLLGLPASLPRFAPIRKV